MIRFRTLACAAALVFASFGGAPAFPQALNNDGLLRAAAINDATADQIAKSGYSEALVKAQVLLDRAQFSPGVIDGYSGGNMRGALAAFAKAHSVPGGGALNAEMWAALAKYESSDVAQIYTITAADVAGPFTPSIPTEFSAMAKLDRLGYRTVTEMIAERFHMDEGLLKRLNPGADFSKAGTQILVTQPGESAVRAQVATIRIDVKGRSLSAFDAANNLVAFYPATVGSSDFPNPSGSWAVNTVATNPTYHYDPKRLTWGEGEAAGKLTIAAGPNNPVGSVWIDLTKDTYGIHGAPEPKLVGKTNSHGCVRLTNWDALALSKAVSKSTKVIFVEAGA